MMYFDLRIQIWLIVGLLRFSESKVILNFRIYNYENPYNVMHDGKKCESFSWMNDHCDPMFQVCVTSIYRCDVLNLFIDHWKNKKFVYNILSRTINLNNMPKSLEVDVKVEDHDRYDDHDHIAMFSSSFINPKVSRNYNERMTVSPSGLHVYLSTSVNLECEENYYGTDCNQFCKRKIFNYECNKLSGLKTCSLDCGIHGSCSWNPSRNEFMCSCNSGWSGDRCQFIHYNNCSMLSCVKICIKEKMKINCACQYDQYIETCIESLPITSTMSTTQAQTLSLQITNVTDNLLVQKAFLNNIRITSSKINRQNKTSLQKKLEGAKLQSVIINQVSNYSVLLIIIFLLLLLCICFLVLVIVIRKLKTKQVIIKHGLPSTISRRPLPPVIYKPTEKNIKETFSIQHNGSISEYSDITYDTCTIQRNYDDVTHLLKLSSQKHREIEGIYKEPFIETMDSFTCQTDIQDGSNDDDVYQEPMKHCHKEQ